MEAGDRQVRRRRRLRDGTGLGQRPRPPVIEQVSSDGPPLVQDLDPDRWTEELAYGSPIMSRALAALAILAVAAAALAS